MTSRRAVHSSTANWTHSASHVGQVRVQCAAISMQLHYLHTALHVGILCGRCRDGYGVGMLSLECRKFKAPFPMYYWLMPILGKLTSRKVVY